MLQLDDLLEVLDYGNSIHYRSVDSPRELETAHLFRAAQEAGVNGIYLLETSSIDTQKASPARPLIYVANVDKDHEARNLHRRLWNLCFAPYIIVRTPNYINVYTGFNYSEIEQNAGLLLSLDNNVDHDDIDYDRILEILADFTSQSIDTGRIWHSEYATALSVGQRVDKSLLKNLQLLGNALKDDGLSDEVANALIGKYVYLSYLRGRGYISDSWVQRNGISYDNVFSEQATISGLRGIINALDKNLNGQIFFIDFDEEAALKDRHISWVASVFSGAEIRGKVPDVIRQLPLPFRAYDFRYIPVETLSTIYEQFIEDKRAKGAVYTPEVLADYLLSEIETIKPIERGTKVFDPSCGSGIFLVLAYRRIIEREMRRLERKLRPEELRDILLESIYGLERERDACYVAEFSLILTMMHYMSDQDLQTLRFPFPDLHNHRIIKADFFDFEGEESDVKFWSQELKFDVVVGNPPWIELRPDTSRERFVRAWMKSRENKENYPIGGKRVAEAFSWQVAQALQANGVVGLLLPATSLFNLESKNYRRAFFTKNVVFQISNFSNLRELLFDRRATLPAATIIYRPWLSEETKPTILHYGPFTINQISNSTGKPWIIIVNENEIQEISPSDAETGETSVWKFALWGNDRDQRIIESIAYSFPNTLQMYCRKCGWTLAQGPELRDGSEKSKYKLLYNPDLTGQLKFDSEEMRRLPLRLSVPKDSLQMIPPEMSYLRMRGGKRGLLLSRAPHIIVCTVWMSYIIFSNKSFVVPPRQIGIAGKQGDEEYLRAVALYLNSSLVSYYLFFHAQQWGVFRQARLVSLAEVKQIPIPEFTKEQAAELSKLYEDLAKSEEQKVRQFLEDISGAHISMFDTLEHSNSSSLKQLIQRLSIRDKKRFNIFVSESHKSIQQVIDDKVFSMLGIPDDMRLVIDEFVQMRLKLDKTSQSIDITRMPTYSNLLAYATTLRRTLDDFVTVPVHHDVVISFSDELIECMVEVKSIGEKMSTVGIDVRQSDITKATILSRVSEQLRERISQWVYVQRGLRLFSGPKVYIYKSPRLIDWSQTQAMNDAGDIIGKVVIKARSYANT